MFEHARPNRGPRTLGAPTRAEKFHEVKVAY